MQVLAVNPLARNVPRVSQSSGPVSATRSEPGQPALRLLQEGSFQYVENVKNARYQGNAKLATRTH